MRKKVIAVIAAVSMLVLTLTACQEADRVSSNISKEADNFNIVRELTVINNFSDTVVFQMKGNLSIKADTEDQQLEITVKEAEGVYKKHFVGLSTFTTYVVEDITGSDVATSKYTLSFNPKMLLPFDVKNRNEDNSN